MTGNCHTHRGYNPDDGRNFKRFSKERHILLLQHFISTDPRYQECTCCISSQQRMRQFNKQLTVSNQSQEIIHFSPAVIDFEPDRVLHK
ncbi:hypothetical protein D3C80_1603330 [compost metagenome]